MNDIKWRYFSNDEDCRLLNEFPKHEVIIHTEVTLRFCSSQDIDQNNCWSEIYDEKILKFAFIEE